MGAGNLGNGMVVVMPMWKRTSITAIQLVMTMLTAGVIIGYGQLYGMLVDAGVYHDKCPANTDDSNVCPEQATALDQLFNIGASVSIFVQAPSGVVLDFLGPRITCWAGLALFIPGCFIFAFAPSITVVDAYMCGFQLLAAGGPFVFLSSMPVAQLWPDAKAMILMMVNGVYGGGAFVFFLFSVLYFHLHISMKMLFVAYGFLGCGMVVVALFVWPKRSFAASVAQDANIQLEDKLTVPDVLRKSLRDIGTVGYVYLALLVALLVLKSNFFLSTSTQQFQLYIPAGEVDKYVSVFGIVLPAVGVLAGPVGLLFDRFGENVALLILIGLSSLSSLCGMLTFVHPTTFEGLTVLRMFVFSVYYPMIYGVWAFFIVAKFGSVNFGVLYGVIAVIAGIVNLSAADPMVHFAFAQNSFFDANLILVSIGGVFAIYPLVQLVRLRMGRAVSGRGYYEPIS